MVKTLAGLMLAALEATAIAMASLASVFCPVLKGLTCLDGIGMT